MINPIKRLAITPGEPAGIGADLVVRLAANPPHSLLLANPLNPPLLKGGFSSPPFEKGGRGGFQLVAIADPALLAARARQLGLALEILPFDPAAASQPSAAGQLHVMPVTLRQPVTPGQLNPANSAYVLDTLARACDGCLDGTFAGVVTAPVHKGVINDAGLPFTGHTEFFAARCHAQPVMMLATPELRVALVTTHLPLAQVSSAITAAHLTAVIRILHRELMQRFGLAQPRILVCGLNPHAGEGGHLGREEIDIIIPVLEMLRAQGMMLDGPLPADTAFVPTRLANADAVLAMYHDQGLPVLKHLGFGRAVNVTLGLPLIRTSVDHGTALELAGTDRADLGSLLAAVALAQALL